MVRTWDLLLRRMVYYVPFEYFEEPVDQIRIHVDRYDVHARCMEGTKKFAKFILRLKNKSRRRRGDGLPKYE